MENNISMEPAAIEKELKIILRFLLKELEKSNQPQEVVDYIQQKVIITQSQITLL